MPSSCFLRDRTDYVRLFRRGQTVKADGWVLYYAPNRLNFPRFSVVISKRNVNLAVRRNRLSRQLRESFRQEWRWQLPALDFLFRATVPPAKNDIATTPRVICLQLLMRVASTSATVKRR